MPISDEKRLNVLVEERKLISERRSLIIRTLAGFNPLVVTVASGAIIGLLTKDLAEIPKDHINWIVFAGSQFAYLMGVFNLMILVWLRIEGLYIARLERQINSLASAPNLVCRESLITPKVYLRSGAVPFFLVFILLVSGYGAFSGIWAAYHLDNRWVSAVVFGESAAMIAGLIYEYCYARKGYERAIANIT